MKNSITPKQLQALPLLVTGMSGVEVAKAVGVKPSTVSGWLHHCPGFMAELDQCREQVIREAMDQLGGTLTTAVRELHHVMTKSKNDALRLKAATFVIEHFGLPKASPSGSTDPADKAEIGAVLQVFHALGINRHATQ